MPASAYTPRDPTASMLYTVVREHVETFRVEAARLRDGQERHLRTWARQQGMRDGRGGSIAVLQRFEGSLSGGGAAPLAGDRRPATWRRKWRG